MKIMEQIVTSEQQKEQYRYIVKKKVMTNEHRVEWSEEGWYVMVPFGE